MFFIAVYDRKVAEMGDPRKGAFWLRVVNDVRTAVTVYEGHLALPLLKVPSLV